MHTPLLRPGLHSNLPQCVHVENKNATENSTGQHSTLSEFTANLLPFITQVNWLRLHAGDKSKESTMQFKRFAHEQYTQVPAKHLEHL